jgi:hypothetical protein
MYVGQNYNPRTPIAPDAYEQAKCLEARWLSARHFLHVQQREMGNIKAMERIGPDSAWTPLNAHDAIHHGDMLVGRCMEHVRR